MKSAHRANPAKRLLGTMDLEMFNRDVREQKSRKFTGAFDHRRVRALFDLSTIERLLSDEVVPTNYIDIISEGIPKRLGNSSSGARTPTFASVQGALRGGATMRISDIQRFDGNLCRFAREVGTLFAARSQINVYVTPPGGSGFKPHFDTTDIFILQCSGTKEWHLYEDYTHQSELPLLETPWDPERYEPGTIFETLTLVAGDVLYLPRGVMHKARCIDQPAVHLTISIAPLTLHEAIIREFNRLAESEIDLRRRLVWSGEAGSDELSEINNAVRQQVSRLLDRIDLEGLLQAETDLLQPPEFKTRKGLLEAAMASPTGGRRRRPR